MGFESGTRALFDQRHGGDPLWLFVDYNNAVNRSYFDRLLLSPTSYYVDENNNFRLIEGAVEPSNPPPPDGPIV